MSSDIQVKDEPVSEDVFNAETDSETEEDIDVDKLQPLHPKFASLSKFPIGCKVWYDLCKSTEPTKCLQAKSAYIEDAFIHFENRKQVYRAKSEITEDEVTLYEDRLVYGANCPVTVTCPDTNEVRNGVIICPKLDKDGDGKRRISYAIQFWQGKKVSVEFGVAATSVKYRIIIDDGRKKEKTVAEKGLCNADKEVVESLTLTNADEMPSKEVHQLPGETIEVEQVETKLQPIDTLLNTNEMREDETDTKEPPKKVAKTTMKEKVCTCVLVIPSWVEDRHGLFRHLLGVDGNGRMGHKTRHIKATTSCSVQISGHEVASKGPMTITITCSSSDVTQTLPRSNVEEAIDMIEVSTVEFVDDDFAEDKLLYELAETATGSYKFPRENPGFIQRKYGGVKKWCNKFDLPGLDKFCAEHFHSMNNLMYLASTGCEVNINHDHGTSKKSYVLIAGLKLKDVQKTAADVVDVVSTTRCAGYTIR